MVLYLKGDSQLIHIGLINLGFKIKFQYYKSDGTGEPLEYTGGFNMTASW